MSNISKISGITVTSILKLKGLAKSTLSKSKRHSFAQGGYSSPVLDFYVYDDFTTGDQLQVINSGDSTAGLSSWTNSDKDLIQKSSTSDTNHVVRSSAYDLSDYDYLEIKYKTDNVQNIGIVYTDDQPGVNGFPSNANASREMRYSIAHGSTTVYSRYLGVNVQEMLSSTSSGLVYQLGSISVTRIDSTTGVVKVNFLGSTYSSGVARHGGGDAATEPYRSYSFTQYIDMTKSIYFLFWNNTANKKIHTMTLSAEEVNNDSRSPVWREESVSLYHANTDTTFGSLSNGILSMLERDYSGTNGYQITPGFEGHKVLGMDASVMSWSIWFRKTGNTYVGGVQSSGGYFPVWGSNYSGVSVGLRILNNTDAVINGVFGNATLSESISSDIEDGNWHHVVVSAYVNGDGNSELLACVDGQVCNTITASGLKNVGMGYSGVTTWLFGYYAQNNYAAGDIDAAEIVEGVKLTGTQMQALYNAGRSGMSLVEAKNS